MLEGKKINPISPMYKVTELDQRVPNIDPALITRYKWRAERTAKRLNKSRFIDSFRWVALEWTEGYELRSRPLKQWAVVAMQNQLKKVDS